MYQCECLYIVLLSLVGHKIFEDRFVTCTYCSCDGNACFSCVKYMTGQKHQQRHRVGLTFSMASLKPCPIVESVECKTAVVLIAYTL